MQLQMIWPQSRWDAVAVLPAPDGYALRTYRPGDDEAIVEVLVSAGFKEWKAETFKEWLPRVIPDGLFVVEHAASRRIVCCTWAVHRPTVLYPFGGELGWVACRPEHTGRRLSSVTGAAVVRRFRQAGYRCIYLQTDDPRLPALKTYLKAGWMPHMVEPDMPGRWQAVCQKLLWAFEPDRWAAEVAATRARW